MDLFTLACASPWLITEDWLRTVLQVAGREELDPELARQIREAREARPSAVAVRAGRPLDGAERISVRDGVAIVPVVGPIVRRGGFFSDVSGATSIAKLAQDFNVALEAPAIRAILFAIDSPGGEVTGVNEFANMLHAARGRKPLVAYIEGLGASAAYWIASACDEIVCDDTAALGSIGVVTAYPKPGDTARTIEIVSRNAPRKRPDVTTESGRAQIQARADALEAVFIATVARNRGVSEQTVRDEFGQGDVFVGQAAVDAGLADRMGSFEATLAGLAAAKPLMSTRPHRAVAQEDRTPMATWNLKDVFSGLFAGAKEQGIEIVAGDAVPADVAVVPSDVPAAAVANVETTQTTALEQAQAELAALKAQQAAQVEAAQAAAETARVQAAEAWAEALVAGERSLPADREALVAVHQACAQAGCAEQLDALFAERAAQHSTAEVLPFDDARLLPADKSGNPAQQRAQAESLMAQTPLGQAALARRRQAA